MTGGYPSYDPRPGTVPHPGETLGEWLREQGHTQAWLAHQLGASPKHVSEIIRGRTRYSTELAIKLGAVTGIPASYWVRLRADYELNQALLTSPLHSHRKGSKDGSA